MPTSFSLIFFISLCCNLSVSLYGALPSEYPLLQGIKKHYANYPLLSKKPPTYTLQKFKETYPPKGKQLVNEEEKYSEELACQEVIVGQKKDGYPIKPSFVTYLHDMEGLFEIIFYLKEEQVKYDLYITSPYIEKEKVSMSLSIFEKMITEWIEVFKLNESQQKALRGNYLPKIEQRTTGSNYAFLYYEGRLMELINKNQIASLWHGEWSEKAFYQYLLRYKRQKVIIPDLFIPKVSIKKAYLFDINLLLSYAYLLMDPKLSILPATLYPDYKWPLKTPLSAVWSYLYLGICTIYGLKKMIRSQTNYENTALLSIAGLTHCINFVNLTLSKHAGVNVQGLIIPFLHYYSRAHYQSKMSGEYTKKCSLYPKCYSFCSSANTKKNNDFQAYFKDKKLQLKVVQDMTEAIQQKITLFIELHKLPEPIAIIIVGYEDECFAAWTHQDHQATFSKLIDDYYYHVHPIPLVSDQNEKHIEEVTKHKKGFAFLSICLSICYLYAFCSSIYSIVVHTHNK